MRVPFLIVVPAATLLASTLAAARPADVIWHGGVIRTGVESDPVEAVAVRDGEIVAVGKLERVQKRQRGDDTVMVDLEGRALVPGWIEAHGRPWAVGLAESSVALNVRSIRELQDALRAALQVTPENQWVVGVGYDEAALEERRHPTRAELDAVAVDRPVIAVHRAGWTVTCNGQTLDRLGFGRDTRDPAGGALLRNADSEELHGVLYGTAAQAALDALIRDAGVERAIRWIETGLSRYVAAGYTTAVESRLPAALVPAYVRAAQESRLPIDVVGYPDLGAMGDIAAIVGKSFGDGTRGVFRLGGVEMLLDGSLDSRTARLAAPYADPPPGRAPEYLGESWYFDDEAFEGVSEAYRNRWDLWVHAAGDGAVDQFLRAVRTTANAEVLKGRRTVLVGAEYAREEQFEALEQLRVLPSFGLPGDPGGGSSRRERAVGPGRAAGLTPLGWAKARRLRFSLHSDAPSRPLDALAVLDAAVRRPRSENVEHAVAPEAALRALTAAAAQHIGEEQRKGRIAVGSAADFTVLSGDPVAAGAEGLRSLRVVETVKNGQTVRARSEPSVSRTGN